MQRIKVRNNKIGVGMKWLCGFIFISGVVLSMEEDSLEPLRAMHTGLILQEKPDMQKAVAYLQALSDLKRRNVKKYKELCRQMPIRYRSCVKYWVIAFDSTGRHNELASILDNIPTTKQSIATGFVRSMCLQR